jgi:serine phosphatase RsbU (regulator of sigma subunit)
MAGEVRVLLVEDDDGDALIVSELLDEAGTAAEVTRARSIGEAVHHVARASVVLLDLGLPDSRGLHGLRTLLQANQNVAIVVLTGIADEHLGAEAVRSGAQDYLVKGESSGDTLHRVIRYAMERRAAEQAQRELDQARLYAQENARLERGLLPQPLLADERLSVASRYLAGGQQRLLGGDFYDVVETGDGWVHAMIGDVCGRGPAEAALGVCLRVAWRALILARRPAGEVLQTIRQILEHERHDDTMFATMCMVSVTPARDSAWVRLAGHLPPVLVTADGVTELDAPASPPPGLGGDTLAEDWPAAEFRLAEAWSVLLYTDGLIEGRIGGGPERLGSEGLLKLLGEALDASGTGVDQQILDRVVEEVRALNQGDLDDDLAVLALSYQGAGG